MARVFIAEDEENILSALKLNLDLEGYTVFVADNGKKALSILKQSVFDLIILDVMLPEIDGFTICENIRALGIDTPVMFLTAKGSSEDKIRGLKIGADDYLTKPFVLEELLLRVKNILKRNASETPDIKHFEFENCEINFETYEIIDVQGRKERISKRELELLKLLIQNKGKVVSREEILDKLWKDENLPTPRTIDNYILTFRKLFEHNPKEPKHFHSIRGVGYKFTE